MNHEGTKLTKHTENGLVQRLFVAVVFFVTPR
jgi:hypothetical protein